MRRYLITLAVMALLIGSLFQAANQTGVRLMAMFGTLGIFLFGVVATLALTRWQAEAGMREVQAALRALEPEHLITDWAHQGGDRPDYLVVGPAGLIAICLDETPQWAARRRAGSALARGRERARQAAEWVGRRLAGGGSPTVRSPGVSVEAVVVLTRCKAEPGAGAEGVVVLNPEHLTAHIRSRFESEHLDRRERVRLTRLLRTG